MNENTIKARLMRADDFDAILAIDEKLVKESRQQYYEVKFEKFFKSKDYLPVSFVAEKKDGTVAGFVMGELYIGEYGIFQKEARLDTIGVDPDYQRQGIGEQLINEFIEHLRSLGVQKVSTLIDWNNSQMIHFISFDLNPPPLVEDQNRFYRSGEKKYRLFPQGAPWGAIGGRTYARLDEPIPCTMGLQIPCSICTEVSKESVIWQISQASRRDIKRTMPSTQR